jgi:hypothetical protein
MGSRASFGNPEGVLPGLVDCGAKFDGTIIPAYSDHWVSPRGSVNAAASHIAARTSTHPTCLPRTFLACAL